MRNILYGLLFLLILASGSSMATPVKAPAGDNSIAIGPAGIIYKTRGGDTLLSIAQQWTAHADNWVALAKLNHISQDSNIPIGTPIVIPSDLLLDEPSQAQVVAISGNVMAHAANGEAIALQVGSTLLEGTQIDTGVDGFLTMSLPDASRISLPSNSRVKLAKLRMARYTKSPRTDLLLLHGHVESRVSPLDTNKGSYEVHTPTSVAGVRGTQFRVGVDGDNVTNEILSGKVAVGTGKPAPEVLLESGQGNVIKAKTVGPATALLAAPQLDSIGYDGAPLIKLLPVAGANTYHVQVANDADALNVVAEIRSADTKVKLVGIAEGAYFARVTAIDKNGLEGLARIQAVNFHAGAGAASRSAATMVNNAPYVDGYDDKQVSLHWQPQNAKEFNLQVARDAQFTWLIFNANTSKPEAHLPRPPFGTYYMRVQSVNADGSANPFSPVQTFIVTDHWVINDGDSAKPKQNSSGAGHS